MREFDTFILIVILLSMIFLHIIDDFALQGKLGLFKQKSWWKENYPDEKYRNDYIVCLFLHAFEWCFMIHIPIIVGCFLYKRYSNTGLFLIIFAVNMVLHSLIDHAKANKLKLNLLEDQFLHICQILVSWVLYLTHIFYY